MDQNTPDLPSPQEASLETTFVHVKDVPVATKTRWVNAANRHQISLNVWLIQALDFAAKNMPIKRHEPN